MGLLKEKTILYVTHQVEFLPGADLILVSLFYIPENMRKRKHTTERILLLYMHGVQYVDLSARLNTGIH